MAGVLLRRSAGQAVLLAVAVSLAYLLAAAALDPRAELEARNPRPSRAVVEAWLARLNADDRTPLVVRYLTWASGAVRGDLGRTLDDTPAAEEMGRRAGVSLRLLLAGVLLGNALGAVLGLVGAMGRSPVLERLVAAGGLTVLAVPVVVLATVGEIAAQWADARTGTRIFAWTGEYTPGRPGGSLRAIAERGRHLVLPTLTIALGRAAVLAHYLRGTLRDTVDAAFVRAAVAKGLTRRRALTRHALRVAVIPVVPLSAYGCATLLAGAACTEKVFAWHGMGEWLIDSIHRGDVNAVAAYCCFAAIVVTGTGLLSDLAVAALDPRTRT
ncbi:ABC transporter permease [Actinoallomurus rhizosphaericola]|uniref:ABC transporter permease n=1 Tax=Actinoallomurus rhizosphaericola TaxID=2952536 RepID=UPI0020918603|nr:ABC transporter permease [Actinoallomurus rhizosphaericola]MCO5992417.1 ABC transporter permease [Actinoallomurus rhizosphaericola]